MRILIIAAASLSLAACATVTRGTTEQVTVTSEPSGASAVTSIGHTCPATPCTFEISRKAEFITTFRMAGYEDQQIPVQTRVAGAGAAGFAGNVIIGGVVGMAADAATGATLEHFPNPVHAIMTPLPRSKKTPRPRKANETPVSTLKLQNNAS
ncbi:translation initiation factor 2 [Microvirga solisilvae]|uniref:translation initiation factor 2 n=1 Tax=Microvirga solisilvae TaxID=2919498 RepID=UPI001FAFC903|nr:translation initiation factor 2 [Microvirga solisilvae]